jgi:DNA-binding cell septation regulator SpoVG
MNITVEFRKPKTESNGLLAYATLYFAKGTENELRVSDCALRAGRDGGVWLAYPSRKGGDGKYYPYVGFGKQIHSDIQREASDAWAENQDAGPVAPVASDNDGWGQ